jgi:hypothetical protein
MIAVFKKKCNRWQENVVSFVDIFIAVLHMMNKVRSQFAISCMYGADCLSPGLIGYISTILRNCRIYIYEEVGVNRLPLWVIPSWTF